VSLTQVLLWGFLATCARTSLEVAAQALGLSRLSLPFLLGTMFTSHRDRAMVLGFLADFLVGWAIAGLYALVFASLGYAGILPGLLLGAGQGSFVLLVVMQVVAHLHPRMASERDGPTAGRMLEPPGFLTLNYGRWTPLTTLFAHIAYGALLGWLFTH